MKTTKTKVTSIDQLAVGDKVRTSGGKLDYRVFRIGYAVTIIATANDGRGLLRSYTPRELAKGNLFKVSYSAAE